MPRATNAQVQQYVNERCRVRAEQFRALRLAIADDQAAIDDVYEHISGANGIPSTFTDERSDGPPHLVTANDVAAYNTFLVAFLAFCDPNGDTGAIAAGADQLPVLSDMCVRPVEA
jgi:hypothetical protein